MKIHEYNQMMAYLTRPATRQPAASGERINFFQDRRIPFANGTPRNFKQQQTRKILDGLKKGSEIDRIKIIKEIKIDPSSLTKIINEEYAYKNFTIKKQPSALKGQVNKPTKAQAELGEFLFGKEWNKLTGQERSNIVNGGYNKDTITEYRRDQINAEFNKKSKELGYNKKYSEMDYESQRRVRTGKAPVDPNRLPANKIKLNKELLELADDPRIMDIFKNPNRDKVQLKKDLDLVRKVLGPTTNAPARLTQLAAALTGDSPVEGIIPKFQDNAQKIYNDLPFTDAQREIDELKIGKSLGEQSITTDKRFIRDTDIYKDASISKLANIDEPSGVTSSVRRGTTPYGIFGQIIGKEQNTTTKMSWDGRKSTLERELQEAIALPDTDKTKKTKINQAVIKFNKAATEFENKLNMQKLRGAKRIRLPRVSLDNPSKTIANWKNFNSKYKDAFNKNFVDRKYSFVIPKDLRTIPELRKDVLNPKSPIYKQMINTLKQGFNEFDEKKLFKKINNATPDSIKKIMKKIPRLASIENNFETNRFASANNIMSDATYVDETESNFIKRNPITSGAIATGAALTQKPVRKLAKKALIKSLGPIGLLAEGYFIKEAYDKGKSPAEIIGTPFMLEGVVSKVQDSLKMLPVERQAASQNELEELEDFSDMSEDFATPYVKGSENVDLEELQKRMDMEREFEREERIRLRTLEPTDNQFINDIIQEYNQGGRVGFAKGPKDPSKRLFIKGLAALSMLPVVGKYFKLAPKAKQAAGVILEKAGGIPEWFQPFVNKVLKEGKDVTKTEAIADRQIVKRVDIEDATVDVHYDVATNDVRVEVVGGKTAFNEPLEMQYKAPEVLEESGKKTKAEFSAAESRPVQTSPDDIELEGYDTDILDDLLSETDYLEGYATGKIRTPLQIKKARERAKLRQDAQRDPYSLLDDFDD